MTGDGIPDIISGSWSSEREGSRIIRAGMLFIFRGREDGTFGPRENLKFASGDNIGLGNASTVFAVDWTGNGQKDLLVGSSSEVWLVRCGNKPMDFQPAEPLPYNGNQIKANGYSHPIAADWNGNGRLDLILGHGNGSVTWYPNEGKDQGGLPILGEPRLLVPPGTRDGAGDAPATRAKICVADFNGNGRLDLLVGDFGIFRAPTPDMSDEQREALAETQQKLNEVQEAFQEKQKEIVDAILKEIGVEGIEDMTDEQGLEFRRKFMEALRNNKEYNELMQESRRLSQELNRISGQPRPTMGGQVWLYERKPAATTGPSTEGR